MKLSLKRLSFAFGLAMAWLVAAPQAHADTIFDNFFFGETNQASDDSAEVFLDLVTGTAATTGIVNVGDVFIGGLQIQSLTDLTGGNLARLFGTDWDDEFTAVFQLMVTSKIGGGGGPTFVTFGSTLGVDYIGVPGGWASGTLIATFTDPANDFSRTGATTAGDLATMYGGSRALDLGYLSEATANTGATGEGFTGFNLSDIVAGLSAVAPPAPVGFFSGALNATAIYAPSAGITYSPVPVTDTTGLIFGGGARFVGTAEFGVQGGTTGVAGVATAFDLFDDANIVFAPQAVVPEPSSIALCLMGAGSLLGVYGRRFGSKKAKQPVA